MGEARPWQIGVVVVGLLVLVGSLVFQCSGGGGPEIDRRLVLVDLSTGELYETTRPSNRTLTYPIKHPSTQQETLVPAEQREDGKWYVKSRIVNHLTEMKVSLEGLADPRTGLSKVQSDPKSIDLF